MTTEHDRNASRLFTRNPFQRTVFDQLRLSPDGLDNATLTKRIMRKRRWIGATAISGAVAHEIGRLLWRLRKRGHVADNADGW